MDMTIDELVKTQIKNYLYDEDFVDKYQTEQFVRDEIEDQMSSYLHSSDAEDKYATTEYVDEEIREQVRSVIDDDEYATEDFVRDSILTLRKELFLEGLVPAEKQKPVNQLDQFVQPDSLVTGYPDWEQLSSFVRASVSEPLQTQMVIAMILATARNIVQEQLDNDH